MTQGAPQDTVPEKADVQTKPKRSLLARAGIALGVLLLVFAGLLATLLVLITLPPGEKLVARLAERQLRKQLGVAVEIGGFETNLLSRLELRDVVLPQPDDSTLAPLARIPRARVTWELLPLLKKRIVIPEIRIDSLHALIRRDADGNMIFPQFGGTEDTAEADTTAVETSKPDAQEAQKKPGFQFVLGKAELLHATLRYDDAAIPLESSVHNLNLTATQPDSVSYAVELRTDSSFTDFDGSRAFANDWLLTATWAETLVTVDTLHLTLPGLDLDFGRTRLGLDSVVTLDGSARLAGDPHPLTRAYGRYIPADYRPIRGKLNLRAEASGPVTDLRVRATLDAPSLRIPNWKVNNARLEAAYTSEKVTLSELRLGALGGTLEGNGHLTFSDPLDHELELRLTSVQLEQLLTSLDQDSLPVRGSVSALLHSRGEIVFPEGFAASLDMRVDEPGYDTLGLDYIIGRLSYTMGRSEVQVTSHQTQLTADLQLSKATMEGDFAFQVPSITPYAAMFDTNEVTGRVDMNGTVTGPYGQPDVRAKLYVGEVTYRNFPLDTLEAVFLYEDGVPKLRDGRLKGEITQIDSTAPPFGVDGLKGSFNYEGTAEWSPDSMEASFRVNLASLGVDTFLIDDAKLLVVADEEDIRIKELELNWNRLQVKGDGRYDYHNGSGRGRINFFNSENPDERMGRIIAMYDQIDSIMTLTVQGIGFNLQQVNTFLPEPRDVEGALTFNLGFEGTMQNPVADLVLRMHNPRIGQVASDTIVALAHLDTSAVELRRLNVYQQGDITNQAQGKVLFTRDSKGGLTPDRDEPISFEASGYGLDLRMLNPFLPDQQTMTGLGNYKFNLSGSIEEPHVKGELRIAGGEYQVDPFSPPITNINMAMALEDSLINIKALTAHIMDTDFKLKTMITVNDVQHINARIHLAVNDEDAMVGNGWLSGDSLEFGFNIDKFQLAALQAFTQDARSLDGELSTTMMIHGAVSKPRLEGKLKVKKLTLHPPFFEDRLVRGTIDMEYNLKEIKLNRFEIAQEGKGLIRAEGNLGFDDEGISDIDFSASFHNLNFAGDDLFEAELAESRIDYTKNGDTYDLTGNVEIREARYTQTLSINKLLAMMDTPEAVQTLEDPNPLLANTRLNIQIDKTNNIWVDNNLARVRMELEAAVTGSALDPNVTGDVIVDNGAVSYLARKFDITSGHVSFVFQDSVSGTISLEAETSIKSYQAMEASTYLVDLGIHGELLSPSIVLTSQPPLDKPDIITLVTVGMTRAQLTGTAGERSAAATGGGASSGDILERRAEEITSQAISGYVDRKVGSAIGLDALEIEGNLFRLGSEDQESMPTIAASKRVSDRVTITYITRLGYLDDQGIRVSYKLTKHFSLEGETHQDGDTGVDLKYRVQFK